MDELKKLFYPSKKKLIAAAFVLLNSLFILEGVWQTEIVTFDEAWPWWQNLLVGLFSMTNFLGSFFQSPYFFLAEFLPSSGNITKVLDTLGILISCYILGSLIGVIWEIKKSKKEKQLLLLYTLIWITFSIGIFFTFFEASLLGFLVFLIGTIVAFMMTYFIKKLSLQIFRSLIILTFIFTIGAFYLTLNNFEDAYCWDKTTEDFNSHIECHEEFNLFKAISEVSTR